MKMKYLVKKKYKPALFLIDLMDNIDVMDKVKKESELETQLVILNFEF